MKCTLAKKLDAPKQIATVRNIAIMIFSIFITILLLLLMIKYHDHHYKPENPKP